MLELHEIGVAGVEDLHEVCPGHVVVAAPKNFIFEFVVVRYPQGVGTLFFRVDHFQAAEIRFDDEFDEVSVLFLHLVLVEFFENMFKISFVLFAILAFNLMFFLSIQAFVRFFGRRVVLAVILFQSSCGSELFLCLDLSL